MRKDAVFLKNHTKSWQVLERWFVSEEHLVPIALIEDMGSVPRIHMTATTVYNSTSRGFNFLF